MHSRTPSCCIKNRHTWFLFALTNKKTDNSEIKHFYRNYEKLKSLLFWVLTVNQRQISWEAKYVARINIFARFKTTESIKNFSLIIIILIVFVWFIILETCNIRKFHSRRHFACMFCKGHDEILYFSCFYDKKRTVAEYDGSFRLLQGQLYRFFIKEFHVL